MILNGRHLLLILFIVTASLISCKKDVCVKCIELNSQYEDEFCGSQKEVDAYIGKLKEYEKLLGQRWECEEY